MEQNGNVRSFSLKFMGKIFLKSGYFWGAVFFLAFGLYNFGSVWMTVSEHRFLYNPVLWELTAFTFVFVVTGIWFLFDLYQIYEPLEYTSDKKVRKLLMDSAYRTARIFYVAEALSIFALLICRMLIANR